VLPERAGPRRSGPLLPQFWQMTSRRSDSSSAPSARVGCISYGGRRRRRSAIAFLWLSVHGNREAAAVQGRNRQGRSRDAPRDLAARPAQSVASPIALAPLASRGQVTGLKERARSLAGISQCAPTARFTSGGRIHPGSCR
jgi:hypothetical protein